MVKTINGKEVSNDEYLERFGELVESHPIGAKRSLLKPVPLPVCSRCSNEIMRAIHGNGLTVKATRESRMGVNVPESECKFWVHEIWNEHLKEIGA